jgi:protein required for attachment to host cells
VRVLESAGPSPKLAEIAVFRNVAAGRHERDLVSDRPGRVINAAAGTRQSFAPRTSARLHSMQVWLKALNPSLRELLQSHDNDSVVLVAAPRMLAELQRQLPPDIRRRVVGTVPLDLVRTPLAALKGRLQPVLRTTGNRLQAQPPRA